MIVSSYIIIFNKFQSIIRCVLGLVYVWFQVKDHDVSYPTRSEIGVFVGLFESILVNFNAQYNQI